MGGTCFLCKKSSPFLSGALGTCLECIRNKFDEVSPHIEKLHSQNRKEFNLRPFPPKAVGGVRCRICSNGCIIPEGERGYCNLRENRRGRLKHLGGTPQKGFLQYYYDLLPTNCVAEWVCPERTHHGYKNLAVFYESCSFNCLFCQNWHWRESMFLSHSINAEELAEKVDDRTACICYFGGDPAPQILHAIKTSKLVLRKKKDTRICWETNGTIQRRFLEVVANLSLESGGCIKFDLKAFNENLNIALTGISNKTTLANFTFLSRYFKERPTPPFLIASSLLIPGYIDEEEVANIAEFIASLNPDIPYSLLAFYPAFQMNDTPVTPRKLAMNCYKIAREAGLTNVHIGNIHLLSS